MTPLPQRKKTAEEISQLRDQLGIPAAVPVTTKMETEIEPSHPARKRPTKPQTTKFRKLIHADGSPEAKTLPPYKETVEETPPERKINPAVQIVEDRELDSLLPKRKRTALELEEMRHHEMLRQLETGPLHNIKFMPCHPAAIAAGYVLAGVGSTGFWVDSYPWSATLTGSSLALLMAGFIALLRPVSRHHAGFIAATSLLVAVFTAIHHFLQI